MAAPSSHLELLPPAAAARAKQLEFFARTRVEGHLKSVNRSRLKGSSTDFLQHRPYLPGDDLRNLDWRLYGRTDRLVTREYEEYTNLDVILALDGSGSMGYPVFQRASDAGGRLAKIDFARHCAAMLAYLLNRQRDRFGLATLAGSVLQYVRPSVGRKHLAVVFRHLVSLQPGGETDFDPCIRQLAGRITRKSVFVFFSDCYQDPDALTRAIGTLKLAGHDVLVYQLYDRTERDLPFPGFTLFRDLETGQVDAADAMEIRRAYRDVFDAHIRRLADGAAKFGIELHSLSVQPDWDLVLARLLRERAGRP